jgi:hypothetical protein
MVSGEFPNTPLLQFMVDWSASNVSNIWLGFKPVSVLTGPVKKRIMAAVSISDPEKGGEPLGRHKKIERVREIERRRHRKLKRKKLAAKAGAQAAPPAA